MSQQKENTAPIISHLDHPLHRHGTWQTYSAVGGLSSLFCEHIAQDDKGYLWVATNDSGACRFDGDEFRAFTKEDGLCDDHVFSVLLDADGRLWFATWNGGLCWYDGQHFHRPGGDAAGRAGSFTVLYEDGQGRIWCGGKDALGYIEGESFHDLMPVLDGEARRCAGIVRDGEGDIWLGLRRRLVRFNGRRFETVEARDEGGDFCVAVDGQGTLWVGLEFGLSRWDGDKGFADELVFPGRVRKLQTDRQGRLWVLTMDTGAFCHQDDRFVQYSHANGLPRDAVNGFWQDHEGSLWFATYGGGPARFDPHGLAEVGNLAEVSYEGMHSLAPPSVMVEDGMGRLWMRSAQAWLGYCREGAFHLVAKQAQRGDKIAPLAVDAAGRVLVGDGQQLLRYCGDDCEQLPWLPVESTWMITAICVRADGTVVLGLQDRVDSFHLSIAVYADGALETLWEERRSEESPIIKIVEGREGVLWLNFKYQGPFYPQVVDGDHQGERGDIGHWHPHDGVSWYDAKGLVTDILLDRRGVLWLATSQGIQRFDGKGLATVAESIGRDISNAVHSIAEDRRGRLWFSTTLGLLCYDGQVIQVLNNLLPSNVLGVCEDRQGRLWLGSKPGVTYYTPMDIPPRVYVQRVMADQIYEDAQAVECPVTSPQVVFEFKGLSFRTPPRQMLYTWRLEGFDEDWQPPRRLLKATYKDLPVGEYTFVVKAIDRDLNYSEPARLKLAVQPDATQDQLDAYKQMLAGSGRATGDFVGDSPALQSVLKELTEAAPTNMTVLILGETGTGKGLAARTLHGLSQRQGGPFIHVNCGAISESLAESELFGHEKGAFTGAGRRQLGKIELAQGGTLFLDEIGDMPLGIQVKLLHLLQERRFERVGGQQVMEADVRVVAATNRDLEAMIEAGQFRQDLYYRLQMYPVQLPPLRQRTEDIGLLAQHFVERYAQHLNQAAPTIEAEALARLVAYPWPGNVRELEYLMQRAVLQGRDGRIEAEQIAVHLQGDNGGNGAVPTDGGANGADILPLAVQERQHIERALAATNWVIEGGRGAAQLLDLKPGTLRARMRKHGLQRPD